VPYHVKVTPFEGTVTGLKKACEDGEDISKIITELSFLKVFANLTEMVWLPVF
jgi:hypothetical protein